MMAKHPVLDRTETMSAITARLQLSCLDDEWLGRNVPHRFVCIKGHIFLRKPAGLYALKKSCAECEQERNAEMVRKSVRLDGVTWLDERWISGRTHYSFRCRAGHTWQRTGVKAKSLATCPICVCKWIGRRGWLADELKDMQRKVLDYGGECLTQVCASRGQLYRFRCNVGHEFEISGHAVCIGLWCPQCARDRTACEGMERLQAVCAAREGACLTSMFTENNARYRFRCRFGHEWQARGSSILGGRWCSQCATVQKTKALPAAHMYAAKYNGQCLTTVYAGELADMDWVCELSHRWRASMDCIRKGDWCPDCA